MEITNQDWKLFRSRLPNWQEAYMSRLNQEYAKILSGEGTPSDKFRALEKRIRQDKRHPGVQLDLRRSQVLNQLVLLLSDDVISFKDLEGFSDGLLNTLHFLTDRNLD